MTIGILQSTLFGDMFGTAAMRAVFGEPAFLARCVEVEAALARAQARLGIVPAEAAQAISAAAAAIAANPESLDLARLRRETGTVGYPILPLVRQLADRAGDAGHHGHRRGAADSRGAAADRGGPDGDPRSPRRAGT